MSTSDDDIDNAIIYEYDRDCDSDVYQTIIEEDNGEEEEEAEVGYVEEITAEIEVLPSKRKTNVIASNVEILEDVEILPEHVLQTIELDRSTEEFIKYETANNEIDDAYIHAIFNNASETDGYIEEVKEEDEPIEVEELEDEEEEQEHEAEADQEINAANGKNIKQTRYLLFDDLVATIVDYDVDNTPIVQFSMGAPGDRKLPVECGICPDVMSESKLSAHLQTHLVPGTNRYKCIYCTETYKDYKYLASHARRHMGIRPYVCEECKLYFSTKQDMRVHNQRRHQEKEHTCEVCGKTFSQNTMLKRHRESTHEKKRRFQCEQCPKAYYKNFSLQEHIRSVHMGQRRMLKCPFCGMQCLDAHKMARHRKLWHLNQENFECDICQEKFTNVHYFDAHKRSIQCRNNTRKMEEQQKNQMPQQPQQQQQQFKQQQPQMKVDNIMENSEFQIVQEIVNNEEFQWQMHDDPQPIGQEIVFEEDEEHQYVELVLPDYNEEIFHQGDNVIFEVTLDDANT